MNVGRGGAAAVAVTDHRDAGCAGQHGPLVGEPPSLLAETAAYSVQLIRLLPLKLCAHPSHDPPPGVVVQMMDAPEDTPRRKLVDPSRRRSDRAPEMPPNYRRQPGKSHH